MIAKKPHFIEQFFDAGQGIGSALVELFGQGQGCTQSLTGFANSVDDA
jgi:hypothetical protein